MKRVTREEFSRAITGLGTVAVSTKTPSPGIIEYYRRVKGQEDEMIGVLIDKAGTVTRYLA